MKMCLSEKAREPAPTNVDLRYGCDKMVITLAAFLPQEEDGTAMNPKALQRDTGT